MVLQQGQRFSHDLLAWSDEELREFPWRLPEATFYEVLVAEFFLARTRAGVVERVYPQFLERFPDFESLVEATEEEIAEVIEPMGLQNRRARALKEMARTLEGQEVPKTRDGLLDLPRVGPYAANATLCFADNRPLPIIDTNVERIFERVLGDEWPIDRDEQLDLLEDLLPANRARQFNLALLDFGALVCKAQSPRCEECFANNYCRYYDRERR